MFFIEWWLVDDVIWCVVVTALCALGLVLSSRIRRRGIAKAVLKIVSGGAGIFALFLIAVTSLFGFGSRYSVPVFSPVGDRAVRIRSFSLFDYHLKKDIIELYTRHGLRNEIVFSGELDGVQPSSIKWVNDAELVVSYSKRIDLGGCKSASSVKVSCISASTTR